MAHAYPEEFIPIGDAFERACLTIEDFSFLETQPANDDEVKPGARQDDIVNRHDYATRKVERLMRNALADGNLHPFIRVVNGQFERLVSREEWRKESFGIPNIENVPHHLANPGPDTDGQPIFLKISEFEDWLGTQPKIRPALPLSQSKKMGELDRDLYPEMSALLKRGDATSVTQAARQVADRAKTRGGTLESVTKRLARGYQKHRRS